MTPDIVDLDPKCDITEKEHDRYKQCLPVEDGTKEIGKKWKKKNNDLYCSTECSCFIWKEMEESTKQLYKINLNV